MIFSSYRTLECAQWCVPLPLQVLHSQSRHVEVRMACIHYLRENREKFEEFIEGSFEEYLKRLENPQEWVGQVEISALSLMYR
ncbi:OTU domain-containing protein 4 [Camelus dromedarius]|uniref:ubiquitinyl hydrolase 1 n=1 Tax=Camelus dromedarius TaxID=9838 RepID=A0A5N4EGP0_CAMDR|nr:OTU domain-containing protein 4 [Camelus dromedarius]